MRYLSLFSGIESAAVAAKNLNWKVAAFSEIADFPCAVLKHHYPQIPNLGDVKNIKGTEYNGTVDLIIGGSPCQDFSTAGNRTGIYGERSGLAREYLRIIAEIQPKWIIWENVPGALTTNSGRDFTKITNEMAKLGYGFTYRVLDAQYFGVPQRRRRIFLVGYFGDWRPPAAVLFEPQSLSGNFEKSKQEKQKTSKVNRRNTYPAMLDDICPTLMANCGRKQFIGNREAFTGKYFVFDFHLGECRINTNSSTLLGRMGTGGNNIPVTVTDLSLRKLTPLECERLQGFPDNYTDIPYKNKEHSPLGKRYEAIGNAIAVPVLRWIFNRMDIVESLLKKR